MAKSKRIYVCRACGAQSAQWVGRCGDCGLWNSFIEEIESASPSVLSTRLTGYEGGNSSKVTALSDVALQTESRIPSGLKELDLVLGGGLVSGSVVLLGGDPGIGKSTLLLQTLSHLSETGKTLYVTGEESLQQVTLRSKRLGLYGKPLWLLAETQVERILDKAGQERPSVMVIDSIQTMFTEVLASAPGSVSQVRESAAMLSRFAKQSNTALFLVGHVTKEGTLAGPRVLEHMVDTVLYFEGESDNRYRMIRAIKNRFGAAMELGIFAMTDRGLKEVSNPSAIFLRHDVDTVPGCAVMVAWEGTRPLLVEVQALVDESHLANPRRVTVGLDHNRLAMLLAVLHRHGGIVTYDQDVFLNVVGGVRVTETAADLAVLSAVISSLRNRPLPRDWVIMGEVGLAGEIRPIQGGQERLKEAIKHGFKNAIIPSANAPKQALESIKVHKVRKLQEALQLFE